MSFFYGQHPYSTATPHRQPRGNFFNQPPPPPHHFGPRHPYHLYAQHPFFAAQQFYDDEEPSGPPAPAPARATPSVAYHSTLDDEEAAALAHLQAIRKKREADQESIRREAAARLRAKQEREAAIQRAIAEKEREEAIARLVRQKEEEYARKIEARRAIEQQRNAEIQRRRQAYMAAHEAKQRYFQDVMAKKAEYAKRYAARYAAQTSRQAAQEAQRQYPSEFDQLNKVLGGLFGIQFAPQEDDKEEKKDVKEKKEEEVKEKKEVHFEHPQPVVQEKKEEAFPENVNQLLNQFLGLRLEPTSEKPSGQTGNKVPEGLNEFLSKFGLVFEPLEVEKETAEPKEEAKKEVDNKVVAPVADPEVSSLAPPATVATSSTPAASSSSAPSTARSAPKVDDAPLTAFLNNFTDLPPFVRDILGNVELAFKEEINKNDAQKEEAVVEGKGKGVASGEKNPPTSTTPTPAESTSSVDSSKSLNKLNNISQELHLVKESFEFPSILAFAPTSETFQSREVTPNLLFNKTNKSYHQQSNKLLQLLLEADSVESDGNREIRKLRKSIVKEVEEAIKELEDSRDKIWRDVRDRREKGEEFELWEESDIESSSNHSVVDLGEDHTSEHIEDSGEVQGFKVEEDEQKEAGTVLFDAPEDESEVPAKEEKVEDKSPAEVDKVHQEKEVKDKEVDENKEKDVKEKQAKVSDEKEEGYELL